MPNEKIEKHLKHSLFTDKNASIEMLESHICLPSGMTSVHKALFAIFFVILLAVALASQAEIDIVVSARGELLLESDVEKVQHLEGGILEDMLIRKGDLVFEGQVIARLKSLDRNSQLATVNTEIIQLELEAIHYQGLITGVRPDFSPYLTDYPALVKINSEAFEKEFNKNQSNEQLITHDITHKSALIASMQARRESSSNQLALIEKQLTIKQTLYQEEMASYLDVLNMQVQQSNMIREIENLDESIMSETFALNKLKKQFKDLIENRNAEYQSQLTQINKDLKLKIISKPQFDDKVERLVVYSPINGTVDKVHFNFESAVISPGEGIADIVPLNNQLHGEIKVPRKDMGFIEKGQQVKVKLDTYNFTKYGFVNGQVKSISRSSYEEKDEEFYLVEILLEQNFLERNGTKYKLSPYMEFTADIKTGSRRVIDYVVKPVMSAIEDAFDER